MSIVQFILRVIDSGVLLEEMLYLDESGASPELIVAKENQLSIKLDESYKRLLEQWNGVNLDVVRINSIQNIFLDEEFTGKIVIGSDPSGFIYLQSSDAGIESLDSDGGELRKIATNFDDFICNYIFGERAMEFAGNEWVRELHEAGM